MPLDRPRGAAHFSSTQEQNDAQFNLIVQAFKFEKWCSALGILEVPQSASKNRSQRPALRGTVESQLRLGNPILVSWTTVALQDMGEKFASATKILAQYASSSPPTPEPSLSSSAFLELPKKNKSSSRWNKFRRKDQAGKPALSYPPPISLGHSSTSSLSQPGSAAPGILLRTKWVTADKARIEELLNSIEKTNDLLIVLLDPAARAQVDRQTDMTILDRVDGNTLAAGITSRPDLKAMAKIKLWQMQEQQDLDRERDGLSTRSFQTSTPGGPGQHGGTDRVYSYQIRDFNRNALPHGEYRTITTLEDRQVLVEWKYYSQDRPIRLEQTLRLGGLVSLLNRNQLYERFMALPCRGLVDDADNSRIGILFSPAVPAAAKLKSLQGLMDEEPVPPPIGQRFELAKHLVAAVHHLHSVDWLHKSIRSDNIVCFREHEAVRMAPSQASAKVPATVPEDSFDKSHGGNSALASSIPCRPLPDFYLVGWDLSRPDHPMELSETLSISTAGFQNRRDMIEMYSHPEMLAQTKKSGKVRYRAEFDIYGLGLVLLEIGLWRTLATLRGKPLAEYCDRLPPKMGEIYWDIVRRCLMNDFGTPEANGVGEGESIAGFSLQVAFERFVVSELERCQA